MRIGLTLAWPLAGLEPKRWNGAAGMQVPAIIRELIPWQQSGLVKWPQGKREEDALSKVRDGAAGSALHASQET